MNNVKKEEFSKLIDLVSAAGINLEKITFLILSDFKIKTEVKAKGFDKVARKKQSQILKYVDKEISPFWINIIELESNEAKDLRRILPKEEFLNYLAGIYISIHSKKITDIDFLIKSTLAEMFHNVAMILKERGLVEGE